MNRKLAMFGSLNSNSKQVLVVMAGGSGTRFWPMSRSNLPKQFLQLGQTDDSLIVESINRFEPLVAKDSVMVVTAQSYIDLVKEHVPDVSVLIEPIARNTAPCLAFAAHYVLKNVGDVPLICIPADHVIDKQKEMIAVFRKACDLALRQDVLITVGIKPSAPETGYGYIQRGQPFLEGGIKPSGAFKVSKFVEKPDLVTATHYIESGEFFWNSGMFVWRPSVLINALKMFLPDISDIASECVEMMEKDGSIDERFSSLYEEMQSVSIDVGIMEKADNAVVFPSQGFSWSDVGSWSSWIDTSASQFSDGHGNVFLGDVVSIGSQDCAILNAEGRDISNVFSFSSKEASLGDKTKLIALVGVEDLVVINLSDSILVCKKSETQRVRQIVDILKKRGRSDLI